MIKQKSKLDEILRDLQPYIQTEGRHALLNAIINGTSSDQGASEDQTSDEKLIMAFQDIVDGGKFVYELCESLDNLNDDATDPIQEKIKRTVRVTLPNEKAHKGYEKNSIPAPFLNDSSLYGEESKPLSLEVASVEPIEGVSVDEKSFRGPQKTNTSIAAIEILNPKVGLTIRDTNAISVFLSLIPTLELSRCVPYLSVNFWNPKRPAVRDDDDAGTLLEGVSLSMFLRGKNTPVNNSNLSSVENTMLRKTLGSEPNSIGYAGMEMFTSPQTMVPENGSANLSERPNTVAVLDRFRPFMSIIGMNINVAPSNGFMSYKTATLELVLHDRSRLHEISDFVRPGTLNETELIIEYGWSNSEGEMSNNKNRFAQFLNQLRVKEKYGISNSSFRFDDSGQVNITLNLFTKGIAQLQSIPAGMLNGNDSAKEFLKLFEELSERIKELSKKPRFQKLFDESYIGSFSSESKLLSLDKKELTKLKKSLLSVDKKAGMTDELREKFERLLSTELKSFQDSIDSSVKKEVAGLASGVEIFPCVIEQLGGSRKVTFPAKTNKSKQVELEQEKAIREEIRKLNEEKNRPTSQTDKRNEDRKEKEKRINEITRKIKSNDVLGFDPDDSYNKKVVTLNKSTFVLEYTKPGQRGLQTPEKRRQIDSYNANLAKKDKLRKLYTERKELQQELKEENDQTYISFQRVEAQGKISRQTAINSLRSKGKTIQRFNPVGGTVSDSVSFGRIIMSFVGKALSKAGTFDEVQFMFHPFNEKATFMRGMSIAKFPISHKEFSEQFTRLLKTNPKLDIQQFVGFVLSEFVNNVASPAYGFSSLYSRDQETGRWERKQPETDKDRKNQADIEDKIIESAGIFDGKFFIPRVQMVPECVPHAEDPSKTILRLHFVDQRATSFSSYFELLKSLRQGDVSGLGLENSPTHPMLPVAPELEENYIKKSQEEAIRKINNNTMPAKVQTNPDDTSSDISKNVDEANADAGKILEGASIKQVKRIVAQGVPTILYGASAGAIKSIGLSSQNDPKLSTINMLRENKNPGTPELNRNKGLPVQIHPVECSMEMLGCPLIDRMQHYFIDFGTGTTADNMYVVNSVEHKIGPGEFSTSVKFVYLESFMTYQSSKKKLNISKTILDSQSKDSS